MRGGPKVTLCPLCRTLELPLPTAHVDHRLTQSRAGQVPIVLLSLLHIGECQLKLVDIRSPSSLFKDVFIFVIRDVAAARGVGIAHGYDQLLGGSQVQCLGALGQVRDSHVLLKGPLADQVEVALGALKFLLYLFHIILFFFNKFVITIIFFDWFKFVTFRFLICTFPDASGSFGFHCFAVVRQNLFIRQFNIFCSKRSIFFKMRAKKLPCK